MLQSLLGYLALDSQRRPLLIQVSGICLSGAYAVHVERMSRSLGWVGLGTDEDGLGYGKTAA